MELKAKIMDDQALNRALTRIAHEIVEHNDGAENIALIGIRTRGVPLAYRLRDKINSAYKSGVIVGILDITNYRDDKLPLSNASCRVSGTNIEFSVEGKNIVLVDDVLFTGRTVRAAIEAIIAMGRPRLIQLAVMVDRGHRELPIRPDFVGKNIPTSLSEIVSVSVMEIDDKDGVELYDMD